VGHVPARAEELDHRHRHRGRLEGRRPDGPWLGTARRFLRGRAADAVHQPRHPARPLGRQERRRQTPPAHRLVVHPRVGRGGPRAARRLGRPAGTVRVLRLHARQRGGARGDHDRVEDLHPLRGRLRLRDHPGAALRPAAHPRLRAGRADRLVPRRPEGPHDGPGDRRLRPRRHRGRGDVRDHPARVTGARGGRFRRCWRWRAGGRRG
jgi:hypothetical protein